MNHLCEVCGAPAGRSRQHRREDDFKFHPRCDEHPLPLNTLEEWLTDSPWCPAGDEASYRHYINGTTPQPNPDFRPEPALTEQQRSDVFKAACVEQNG